MKDLGKLLALSLLFSAGFVLSSQENPIRKMTREPLVSAAEIDIGSLIKTTHSEKALIIDLRAETEYLRGHVPGAKNVSQPELASLADRWRDAFDDAGTIILYANRDASILFQAARLLGSHGWSGKIEVFPDGWEEWIDCRQPVATGAE